MSIELVSSRTTELKMNEAKRHTSTVSTQQPLNNYFHLPGTDLDSCLDNKAVNKTPRCSFRNQYNIHHMDIKWAIMVVN